MTSFSNNPKRPMKKIIKLKAPKPNPPEYDTSSYIDEKFNLDNFSSLLPNPITTIDRVNAMIKESINKI